MCGNLKTVLFIYSVCKKSIYRKSLNEAIYSLFYTSSRANKLHVSLSILKLKLKLSRTGPAVDGLFEGLTKSWQRQ